jgi:folate-binding protein YgfZ
MNSSAICENGYCLLPEIGVLSLSGKDAAKLLQGQATCDILGLPPGQTTLGALCTAKGRVVALFRVLRLEDRIDLLMPAELLETVRKHLQKYVLRADVKIEDASGAWSVFGLVGASAADAALHALGLPPLDQDNEAEGQGGLLASFYVIRIPDPDRPRLLVLVDHAKAEGIGRFLEAQGIPRWDATRWLLEDIRAGLPTVVAATVEEFVPQMLNLDLLGGISFTKGCYTGQEIVARTHYLGAVKRRMYRLVASAGPVPQPGASLLANGVESQGSVVAAAPLPAGGFELLAVLNVAQAKAPDAGFTTASGSALNKAGLPYAPPSPASTAEVGHEFEP